MTAHGWRILVALAMLGVVVVAALVVVGIYGAAVLP